MLNTNAQNDEDMLRQMRTLDQTNYFHYCFTVVILELFESYCTAIYCCICLYTAYKKINI